MEQTFVSGQKMTENTEKKKTVLGFLKEHKKEIVIGSAIACAVIVGVVIFKNRTVTNALNIREIVAKGLNTQGDAISVGSGVVETCHALNLPSSKPINVREHLRNLPDGWKPSQSKIDLAARYGFSLGDHQTWVNPYAKAVA